MFISDKLELLDWKRLLETGVDGNNIKMNFENVRDEGVKLIQLAQNTIQ
jgi:hypothetical protein